MKKLKAFLASAKGKAYERLFSRACVAGASVVVSGYISGNTDYRALMVGGALAFCEAFTPLNSLVGFFKKTTKPAQ